MREGECPRKATNGFDVETGAQSYHISVIQHSF